MTNSALWHRVRPGGPWQVLLPGVYFSHTGQPGHSQQEMAALLYAGPGSVLTGAAALSRHGLRAPETSAVNVLIPASRVRQGTAFARVHRTSRMPRQVCASGQIHFAMPPRAVADAVRWVTDAREVRAIVASAVQRGMCPVPRLAEELDAGPVRGSALLRLALAEVSGGIRSVAEADFQLLIKRAGLPLPVFNPRLYAGETFIGMPDCWWPDAGVAAEVDSREWHLSPADWQRTLARHARMSSHGIIVLHVTPAQIAHQPEKIAGELRSALAAGRGRAPLPITARPAR